MCLPRRLLVVDIYGLIHRAMYHLPKQGGTAVKDLAAPPASVVSAMVLEVATSLGQYVSKTQPTHFVACFDPPGKNWR